MGLEGAVKAGFKKELEAVADPKEREALYNKLVDQMYERGKAVNMASYLEIDAVIDPAETRTHMAHAVFEICSITGQSTWSACLY